MTYFTSDVLANGTPLAFEFGNKNVTKFAGLPEVMKIVRKNGLIKPLAEELEKHLPRHLIPYLYTHTDLIEQHLAGIFTENQRFSDANEVKKDPYYRACFSRDLASPATLCRNAQRINQYATSEQKQALEKDNVTNPAKTDARYVTTTLMDRLSFCLLNAALKVLKKHPSVHHSDRIIIDVDGTPIPLYGRQHMSAFDGHYKCNCYLPIFVTINGCPAFIQNAPGAANGAALLLIHIDEILERVKAAFPGKLIIVRGDTGYNNDDLMAKIAEHGCRFIIGANTCGGKTQTKVLKQQVLKDLQGLTVADGVPEAVLQYLAPSAFQLTGQALPEKNFPADVEKFRCCGILRNYKPKSWATERSYICYRLQYNSVYRNNEDGGINIRYIQTNMTESELLETTQGRGQRKERASVEASLERNKNVARLAIEFYEALFCDRGMDERLNCEWKSQCYASCCSCEGFFGNSFMMLLAGFAMLALVCLRLKVFPHAAEPSDRRRNSRKPNVSQAHKAEKSHVGPSIRSIRRYLINIPAVIRFKAHQCHVSLGDMRPCWKDAFERLIHLTS